MRKKTNVILLENIAKLGKKFQVVNVAAGYARNFLLPFGHATLNDKAGKSMLEAKMNARDRLVKKIADSKDTLKSQLESSKIEFAKKVSKKGTLYGSLTTTELVEKIKGITGIKLDEDMIIINDHIKKPGEYNYTINLSADTKLELSLNVVPANA